MEKIYKDSARPGESGPLSREKIRFRASPRFTFPSSDISQIQKRLNESIQGQDREIIQFILTFMGLYGVDSPLPAYFSEIIAELAHDVEASEMTEEDGIRALRDFLDIFDHRIYSLYYRSWKKYRYYLNYKEGAKDKFSQYMLSFMGLGTPDLQRLTGLEISSLLAYTGIISQQTRCPEGLSSIISDYFGGVDVTISEFMPRWVQLPDQYKPRLGGSGKGVRARLGENVTLGDKARDFRGKFRIIIGPLNLDTFRQFLPGGAYSKKLRSLVRFYMSDQLSFDVKLLLRKDAVPDMRLGEKSTQLGWVSWLGKPKEDVVSIVFSIK